LEIVMHPSMGGRYLVRAVVQDACGRSSLSMTVVNVFYSDAPVKATCFLDGAPGTQAHASQMTPSSKLLLLADHTEYRIGQTAHYTLVCDCAPATAVIQVRHNVSHENRMVNVDASGVLHFDLPVREQYLGGAEVFVTVFGSTARNNLEVCTELVVLAAHHCVLRGVPLLWYMHDSSGFNCLVTDAWKTLSLSLLNVMFCLSLRYFTEPADRRSSQMCSLWSCFPLDEG
jgi:hypothetical protein